MLSSEENLVFATFDINTCLPFAIHLAAGPKSNPLSKSYVHVPMQPLNEGDLKPSTTTDDTDPGVAVDKTAEVDADADADLDDDADADPVAISDDAEPFTRSYLSDDDAYERSNAGSELHGMSERDGQFRPSFPSPVLPPSPNPGTTMDPVVGRRLNDGRSNRYDFRQPFKFPRMLFACSGSILHI